GELATAAMRIDPNFGFAVPLAVSGVDPAILDPRGTWADPTAYDAAARKLVGMFVKNFARFEDHVEADIRAASPMTAMAAE
ncbi:MAG: phosphoenolpyruvate carboxykinase (ATP), partial [Aestuariivirga sp.]